jgi:prophage regulatory protein
MPESLLSITEVSRRVCLSKTTIYDRIRAKTFPRARDLGPGCVRWLESEIDAWIKQRPPTQDHATRAKRHKETAQ